MKLKSKSRIKRCWKFGRFDFYDVQVQNREGNWISFADTIHSNRELALEIKKLIINNPSLITGHGYLFDIDYEH